MAAAEAQLIACQVLRCTTDPKNLQPRTLKSVHGWQAQAERSKWQHRHTQLGRLAAWPRPLAWSWAAALRLGYVAVDHTRNALILSVFGFKVSAEPCKLGRGCPWADGCYPFMGRQLQRPAGPSLESLPTCPVIAPDAGPHEQQALFVWALQWAQTT